MTQDTHDANIQTSNELSTPPVFTFEWENVLRIIGSITGIAGVTGALLFLFGFAYNVGTSTAMGFPADSIITISNERYLILGLETFLFFLVSTGTNFSIYLIITISIRLATKHFSTNGKHLSKYILVGRICGTLFFVTGIILLRGHDDIYYEGNLVVFTSFLLLVVAIDILKLTLQVNSTDTPKTQNKDQLNISLFSILSIAKIITIMFMAYSLFENYINLAVARGISSTCSTITTKPTSVILFTDKSIAIDGETQNGVSYFYEGYYLLFFDNDTFYLYRDIDSDSLKPKSVFVIKKDNLQAIKMESVSKPSNWNFTTHCLEYK